MTQRMKVLAVRDLGYASVKFVWRRSQTLDNMIRVSRSWCNRSIASVKVFAAMIGPCRGSNRKLLGEKEEVPRKLASHCRSPTTSGTRYAISRQPRAARQHAPQSSTATALVPSNITSCTITLRKQSIAHFRPHYRSKTVLFRDTC